ncbi:hypothetical protein M5K25_002827 [Dendrobium thyrsiflorum]|uniref:Glutaredoxin domain-containing protein n=1 Tax=Dendrobium thyrsiflorum TaxID=117978 RepID=A0ABD0VPI5_DENTH
MGLNLAARSVIGVADAVWRLRDGEEARCSGKKVVGSWGLRMGKGDGAELQSALAEWTGQRSVPNIFIGGNHIGGKADLMKKQKEGFLITLLTEAGALPSSNPAV